MAVQIAKEVLDVLQMLDDFDGRDQPKALARKCPALAVEVVDAHRYAAESKLRGVEIGAVEIGESALAQAPQPGAGAAADVQHRVAERQQPLDASCQPLVQAADRALCQNRIHRSVISSSRGASVSASTALSWSRPAETRRTGCVLSRSGS